MQCVRFIQIHIELYVRILVLLVCKSQVLTDIKSIVGHFSCSLLRFGVELRSQLLVAAFLAHVRVMYAQILTIFP